MKEASWGQEEYFLGSELNQEMTKWWNIIRTYCLLQVRFQVFSRRFCRGFFFVLDLGATVTLVFDLTWARNWVLERFFWKQLKWSWFNDSSLVSLWQFEVSRELFCASAEGEEAGKVGTEFHGQCKPAIHINPLRRSHFSQALKTSRAGRAGARASRNLDQSLEFLALA